MQFLTCQHCRTKVAVNSDRICPSCRKPTTDVPSPIADDSFTPADIHQDKLSDTNANRVFRIASFFCAGLQFVLVTTIAVPNRRPVIGGNALEHLVDFVEVLTIIPELLLLQVIGSAFGLGAGSFKITCIVFNIICCMIFAFCGLFLLIL